jgi:hypothetical protein
MSAEAKRIMAYEDYEIINEPTEHMSFIGSYDVYDVYEFMGSFYVVQNK